MYKSELNDNQKSPGNASEAVFKRTEMLLGCEGLSALAASHVAVFGIGGVGGAAAEALARGGIGAIDLIDRDTVEASNINRQTVAFTDTVGRYKTDIMKERIARINPDCRVRTYELFYLPETAGRIDLADYDYIVDAVDTVTAKIELIMRARQAGTPVISSMGAGNRLDPSAFSVCDIYETSVDPLARVMRRELKKRGVERLKVVCSSEPPVKPVAGDSGDSGRTPGSVSFVPPVAGLIMAGAVIRDLAGM